MTLWFESPWIRLGLIPCRTILKTATKKAAGFMWTQELEKSVSIELASARLSCDQVLRIAWKDAENAYRELSGFSIRIAEEAGGWHVDYELKDERARGGGPHYVIHPITGKILAKRYEQ